MTREELLKSREYWISKIQIDLFNLIEDYRKSKNYTKMQLAEELGFTKGYISQVLNGDFDHKVSKLVDLALSCGKVPDISFISPDNYATKHEQNNTAILTEPTSIDAENSFLGSVKIKQVAKIIPFTFQAA